MLKRRNAPEQQYQHQRLATEDEVDEGQQPSSQQPKVIKKNFGKIHTIYTSCAYKKPRPTRFIDSEISSSLSFQKLCYFNVFYSIMHFYIYVVTCIYRWKVFRQSDIFDLLRLIFVFIPWGIVEIFRISNGYTGNIKESFPEICSFFLQTCFQIGINMFLVTCPRRLPIEGALITIQIIFNLLELIFCIVSIIKLRKAQNALFFWKSPYGKPKTQSKDDIIREHMESKRALNQLDESYLDESRYMDDGPMLRNGNQNRNNQFYNSSDNRGINRNQNQYESRYENRQQQPFRTANGFQNRNDREY